MAGHWNDLEGSFIYMSGTRTRIKDLDFRLECLPWPLLVDWLLQNMAVVESLDSYTAVQGSTCKCSIKQCRSWVACDWVWEVTQLCPCHSLLVEAVQPAHVQGEYDIDRPPAPAAPLISRVLESLGAIF